MAHRARLLVAFAALSLLAVGSSPEMRQSALSYKTEAKRADMVVKEIAAQTGLALETTEDAKKHILIISVTDVDADALLERIARVTSSRWDIEGEKRTLVADQARRRQEESERSAKRIEAFKKAQEEIREELNRKPGEPEADSGDAIMMRRAFRVERSPAEHALKQLALLIDPDEVGKLGDEARIVFSTAPNRMQRRMRNAQVDRILNELFASHNAWAAAKIREREETMKGMDDPETRAYMEMFGFKDEAKLFETPPSKALLVLEMESSLFAFMSGSPTVKLKVYDQKGQVVVQASETMGNEWFESVMAMDPEVQGQEEASDQKITAADRALVEFSEKTRALNAIDPGESFEIKFPESLLAILSDPVTNDPLGFHHTDVLHAIAKVKNLDVVANLSDSAMEMFTLGMGERGVTVGQAYNSITNDSMTASDESDGWLALSPLDPIAARERRQDREVLKGFIDTVRRDGTAKLDTLAAFALRSPKPDFDSGLVLYLLAFAPNTLQGLFSDTMDWDMLQIYGSMLPNQRITLRQGGRLPIGSLTPQAKQVLNRFAFSSRANIQPAANLQKAVELPFFFGLLGGMFGETEKDFTEEPTEVMPNGLPNEGFVELKVAVEPIATSDSTAATFFFGMGALGADELAMFELMTEFSKATGEGLGELGDMIPMPKHVRIGSREKLNFFFWLSPAAGINKTLTDDTMPKNSEAVPLSDLPPAFRQLIDQRKKAIKDSPYGKMLGGIGFGGS